MDQIAVFYDVHYFREQSRRAHGYSCDDIRINPCPLCLKPANFGHREREIGTGKYCSPLKN